MLKFHTHQISLHKCNLCARQSAHFLKVTVKFGGKVQLLINQINMAASIKTPEEIV